MHSWKWFRNEYVSITPFSPWIPGKSECGEPGVIGLRWVRLAGQLPLSVRIPQKMGRVCIQLLLENLTERRCRFVGLELKIAVSLSPRWMNLVQVWMNLV